jgi:hypothetical protein
VRERGDLDLLVEAARVWAEQGGTATFLDLRRLDDAETKVFHRVVDITTAHCR